MGSINLAEHIKKDDSEGAWSIDFEKLEKTTLEAALFLDMMVDANRYVPSVPKLRQAAMACRRIGLGIMGLHDLLMAIGVPYDSEDGRLVAEEIMHLVRQKTFEASVRRAKEVGSYPALLEEGGLEAAVECARRSGVSEKWVEEMRLNKALRNAAQNTIAPTGTLSTVAGCEGYGCEPVFMLAYRRWMVDPSYEGGRRPLDYVSAHLRNFLELKFAQDKEIKEKVLEQVIAEGSVQGVDELSEYDKAIFKTAVDMRAEDHVAMQIALQKYVDNSISKTINMPEEATIEDVEKAYVAAWKGRCKGLTVYRTNSRQMVVLENTSKKESSKTSLSSSSNRMKRPALLRGETRSMSTPVGEAYVTINNSAEDNQPFEVFVQASKAGSETAAMTEAIGRLISYILRMPYEEGESTPMDRLRVVQQQLSNIAGGRSVGRGPTRVKSLPDGLAKMLKDYIEGSAEDSAEGHNEEDTVEFAPSSPTHHPVGDLCPDCGNPTYVRTEGCLRCLNCGRSECS